MIEEILPQVFSNQWIVLLFIGSVLLLLAEFGFRWGLRLCVARDEAREDQISGIQGAVLGLLGLLLGFTFAMAVNHYDTRRGLVLKEANAIGTTYLRALLLPDSHQAPVRDLLRRYTDARIKYQPLAGDPDKFAEGAKISTDLQNELWKHAIASAREAPNDITAAFVNSLNETIDTHSERLAAARANIPGGAWLLLIIVAGFGSLTTGYESGAKGARTVLSSVFLPFLISIVIVLIFDLSHSRQGLIRITQQPMLELQQSMKSDQP